MTSRAQRTIEGQLDGAGLECARNGGQLTALRRCVLGLILEAGVPLTAYQLLDRLKKTRKGAAPPTVYRALDFLLDQKLIHKIERINAFMPCTEPGQHHHPVQFLICRACGTVAEVEDRAVSRALRDAAAREGFEPRSTIVEIEGTCAACARPS